MRLTCVFALFILLHLLLPTTSKAGILIDSLDQSGAGTSAVNDQLEATESWTAFRFTIGTGTRQFNGLTARFREDSSLTPVGLQVEVRTETGAPPGTVVVRKLTSATDIVGEADYSFSPTVPFMLDRQTSYWLVAKTTDINSLYGWFLTTSSADNSRSSWSLADDYLGTANSGLFWAGPLPAVPVLSINATQTSAEVPEPSSLAFVGLSFIGLSSAATYTTHRGEVLIIQIDSIHAVLMM